MKLEWESAGEYMDAMDMDEIDRMPRAHPRPLCVDGCGRYAMKGIRRCEDCERAYAKPFG